MGGGVILGNLRGFKIVGDYCLKFVSVVLFLFECLSFLANEVIGLGLENNRDS